MTQGSRMALERGAETTHRVAHPPSAAAEPSNEGCAPGGRAVSGREGVRTASSSFEVSGRALGVAVQTEQGGNRGISPLYHGRVCKWFMCL